MKKQKKPQTQKGKITSVSKPLPQAKATPAPASASQQPQARPANNTTCDIYYSPNVPPAAPDVAGAACTLVARFQQGSESSEGDQTFRWTHVLFLDAAVDVRDSYPSAPSHRVYVPDKTGTGFDVVFVEIVNRGLPSKYKRVFLDRRAVTFPTDEL
jgi:hypothetical protein